MSKEEKDAYGIIRLDVYTAYCDRPSLLLYDRKARKAQELKDKRKLRDRDTLSNNALSPAGNNASNKFRAPKAAGLNVSNQHDSNHASKNTIVTRQRRSSTASRKESSSSSLNSTSTSSSSIKPVTRQTSSELKPISEKKKVSTPKTGKDIGTPIAAVSQDILKTYTEVEKILPTDEGYEKLQPDEVQVCSTLRLPPTVYLSIKETLLAARHVKGTFKKREAQTWCRVDVNKTGKIFDWFVSKGWLNNPPPGRVNHSRKDDD
ncbi:hypothetical protein HDU96_004643 [Phlyctochytrium bullatum]|nr:hypothetical protein HDU96_004643 [Phlyctochytrium bullatum]